jgi:hypothetical protein
MLGAPTASTLALSAATAPAAVALAARL